MELMNIFLMLFYFEEVKGIWEGVKGDMVVIWEKWKILGYDLVWKWWFFFFLDINNVKMRLRVELLF